MKSNRFLMKEQVRMVTVNFSRCGRATRSKRPRGYQKVITQLSPSNHFEEKKLQREFDHPTGQTNTMIYLRHVSLQKIHPKHVHPSPKLHHAQKERQKTTRAREKDSRETSFFVWQYLGSRIDTSSIQHNGSRSRHQYFY